jgi:hypothetical protein
MSSKAETYTRYLPCPMCEGSGNEAKWIDREDFVKLLHQVQCSHQYTSYQGSMYFSIGNMWDGIAEVCNDFGVNILFVKTSPLQPNAYASFPG